MTSDVAVEDARLESMITAMQHAPQVYLPSRFWERLSELNTKSLSRSGYDNFKRTVNQNYFNFPIFSYNDPQFRAVLRKRILHPSFAVFQTKWKEIPFLENQGTPVRPRRACSWVYKAFVCMLWEYARSVDSEGILNRVDEPMSGNPLPIFLRDKLISQDLANSVLEYYSIKPFMKNNPPRIAELGAGYGRLAYVFLKVLPCKYAVFDIPPALYIAQRYLSELFPNLRVFEFRDFKHYEEIQEEYEASDIAFFLPHQLDFLPSKQFDLFVNISSFHEMTLSQIANYFALIQKTTRGLFYNKQWSRSVNQLDGIIVKPGDYPVLPQWKRIFFRKHPVQRLFFEALYQID